MRHQIARVVNPGASLAAKSGVFLRFLSPEVSRVTGRFALSCLAWLERATGIGLSPAMERSFAHAANRTDPIDMSVAIPGFGQLRHPVGLGAGYERDGSGLDLLPMMGVSFAEVGSLVLENQAKAPQVRGSRSERSLVVDPFGGASAWPCSSRSGSSPVRLNISRWKEWRNFTGGQKSMAAASLPVALNFEVPLKSGRIRAAAAAVSAVDYLLETAGKDAFSRTADLPVVFSWGLPGQAEGRQESDLSEVLRAISAEYPCWRASCPGLSIWVKVGPGLPRSEFEQLVESIADWGFTGIVVGSSRPVTWPARALVSGAPAFAASNSMLEWAWGVHRGALPMIGSGGVVSGEDAFQKILRGASAVEIMTSLWLNGPLAAFGILSGLEREMRRCGAKAVSECIGAFFDR